MPRPRAFVTRNLTTYILPFPQPSPQIVLIRQQNHNIHTAQKIRPKFVKKFKKPVDKVRLPVVI